MDGGTAGRAAAGEYYAALDGAEAGARVLDAIDGLDLSLPQPSGPGHAVSRMSGYLTIPARDLARRVLRPRIADYALQKFPGLDLDEMRRELARLSAVSGRYSGIHVAPLAHQCYGLTA
jgi:hypothetical protein